MNTRQAVSILLYFTFLFAFSSCSKQTETAPAQTLLPPTVTKTPTVTASPTPPALTPTPAVCLLQPGEIVQDVIAYTNPLQEFLVYLPPCYSELTDLRYPVLYLLHGQTYTQDQWIRLGAPQAADRLIHSGESLPFIMVFPDDRYWYAQPGAGFGSRLILDILPHVDETYRTIPDRDHRSLGGLSRGGGWAIQIGFQFPELFGSLSLHSPAIFNTGASGIERTLQAIPEESRPRLWVDVGDADRELLSVRSFLQILTRSQYVHQYHLYAGDHSEAYWRAHVEEYLRWHILGWQGKAPEQ